MVGHYLRRFFRACRFAVGKRNGADKATRLPVEAHLAATLLGHARGDDLHPEAPMLRLSDLGAVQLGPSEAEPAIVNFPTDTDLAIRVRERPVLGRIGGKLMQGQ